MKLHLKTTILAAAGVALMAQTASASNTFAQGDLMLAFREAGHNDLILDIGASGNYFSASATINLDTVVAAQGNATYTTLSSLINHTFGSASGVTWSVAGAARNGPAVSSLFITDPTDNTAALPQAKLTTAGGTYIGAYSSVYATASAGNTLVANLAVDPSSGTAGTYSLEHANVVGQTGFAYESTIGSGNSIADFYTFNPSTPGALANGFFEIDPNGNGQYVITPTPEPTTYSLLAAGGLLAWFLRRPKRASASLVDNSQR
jgi:hypothetical protein